MCENTQWKLREVPTEDRQRNLPLIPLFFLEALSEAKNCRMEKKTAKDVVNKGKKTGSREQGEEMRQVSLKMPLGF